MHDGGRSQRRAAERERARRRRAVRRRRFAALAGTAALLIAAIVAIRLVPLSSPGGREDSPHALTSSTHTASTTSTHTKPPPPPGPPFAVGVRTMRFVDSSRTVTYRNGVTGPRILNTEVRYPAQGAPSEQATPNAEPQRSAGPFPLIVFGHGFEKLPVEYHNLLHAWAQAGYVVAAPIFPAENRDAPGGPERKDLVNEPGDFKFVIDEMVAADHAAEGPFSGLIAPEEIAVSGQSDGGDAALAVAYDESNGIRDPAIRAAAILSGAESSEYIGSFGFAPGGPPLLATQGTADVTNTLEETLAYFDQAQDPKFLLELIGAEHLGPYQEQEPQLHIVQQVSTDFFNYYLKHRMNALSHMIGAGSVAGVASMQVDR